MYAGVFGSKTQYFYRRKKTISLEHLQQLMKIAILTNEYPPNVYGGAGVHVEYLTKELAALDDGGHEVSIYCFGDQMVDAANLTVRGILPGLDIPFNDRRHAKFMDTVYRDIIMAGSVGGVDIVHCHTWYSHLAGCLVRQLADARLVLTTHSLEPHRPWKVEQLGTAYHASSWIEKTAYQNADGVIAVSESMKQDVHDLYDVPFGEIEVIPNGIDPDEYRPRPNRALLQSYHINPDQPFILFVGRITRQKGIIHLVNAIKYLRPGTQVVLCAGAPDTKEIEVEMAQKVALAQQETEQDIVWIPQMLPRPDVITLYSEAAIFVCPSVYEPFGIINLEAMACETPVVASAVGGIPGVVVHGETGLLVPFEARSVDDNEPRDPDRFARDLAGVVNALLDEPGRLVPMGKKGRERVNKHFSWRAVAGRTLDFYQKLEQRKKNS